MSNKRTMVRVQTEKTNTVGTEMSSEDRVRFAANTVEEEKFMDMQNELKMEQTNADHQKYKQQKLKKRVSQLEREVCLKDQLISEFKTQVADQYQAMDVLKKSQAVVIDNTRVKDRVLLQITQSLASAQTALGIILNHN